MKRHLIALVALLVFSLACRTVQRVFLPSTSTPLDISPQATPTLADDASPDACLDRLDRILQERSFTPIGNEIYESNSANFNLVVYQVEGDTITDPQILYAPAEYHKYQEDTASHQRIWDFYIAIIPAELRTMVQDFVIFTDGAGVARGAWVRQVNGHPDKWQVGFDLLDSSQPIYLADALVHETAHLLTLNVPQVPINDEEYYFFDGANNAPDCSRVVVDGGCSLPDSYINLFHQRFWKYIYSAWWRINQDAIKEDTFDDFLDVMEQFYEMHSDQFLNSYAATNIKEDLAESFTAFVLEPKPTGDSIPEQKIAFFYEFPELVEYRWQIIEGVCSYVK